MPLSDEGFFCSIAKVACPFEQPTSRTELPSLIYFEILSISRSIAKLSPHDAEWDPLNATAWFSQKFLMKSLILVFILSFVFLSLCKLAGFLLLQKFYQRIVL